MMAEQAHEEGEDEQPPPPQEDAREPEPAPETSWAGTETVKARRPGSQDKPASPPRPQDNGG